jgi:hypothetical protein
MNTGYVLKNKKYLLDDANKILMQYKNKQKLYLWKKLKLLFKFNVQKQ